MMTKKEQRLRRSRQTRLRIAQQEVARLSVHRSDKNISAQIIDDAKGITVASASSLESDKGAKSKGSDVDAAARIGKLVAERAIEKGVTDVVFDRGSYIYHGRVKALAEAAREAGLNF